MKTNHQACSYNGADIVIAHYAQQANGNGCAVYCTMQQSSQYQTHDASKNEQNSLPYHRFHQKTLKQQHNSLILLNVPSGQSFTSIPNTSDKFSYTIIMCQTVCLFSQETPESRHIWSLLHFQTSSSCNMISSACVSQFRILCHFRSVFNSFFFEVESFATISSAHSTSCDRLVLLHKA